LALVSYWLTVLQTDVTTLNLILLVVENILFGPAGDGRSLQGMPASFEPDVSKMQASIFSLSEIFSIFQFAFATGPFILAMF